MKKRYQQEPKLSDENYTDILKRLGVKTNSGEILRAALGTWGGKCDDEMIVVTAWIDSSPSGSRPWSKFEIKRPTTNHAGLLALWRSGQICVGTRVRLIVIDPGNNSPAYGEPGRKIKSAKLMDHLWHVSEMTDGGKRAFVEPETNAASGS